jgi:hypothetical protein
MTRLRYLVPVMATLLALTGLATAANASTPQECQTKIDVLSGQTESAHFLGPNAAKNRAGLMGKLDAATAKLAEGKPSDATLKLTDFRATIEGLNGAKPKIDPVDAAALVAGADDAIGCINDLQPTA